MRNLFLLNGIIPAVIANSLIEAEYRNDENVVVVEYLRAVNKVWSAHTGPPGAAYEAVVRHIISLLPAASVMDYAFTSCWPTLRHSPLTYLKEAWVLREGGSHLRNTLAGRFDRMIYSGNTRLPFALGDIADQRLMIEHGIGEYLHCAGLAPGHRQAPLKNYLIRAATGIDRRPPDQIVLLDGGRCVSVAADHMESTLITRRARPDISEFFGKLRTRLESEEPLLMAEFAGLAAEIESYDQVFLYLPAEDLPHEAYPLFLDDQLAALKPSRALFVIKPHPVNQAEYREMFAARGHRAVLLSHPLARHLPAEFYAFMFPCATMVGIGSSSLFYTRWWLDRDVLYLGGRGEVEGQMYRDVRAVLGPDITLMSAS